MGTLTKHIRKRANKFENALRSIEKQFDAMAQDTGVALPTSFNLSKTVENDVTTIAIQKRKLRNKKKALRRQQRSK